ELGRLGSDAYRTSIQVTLPRHHATDCYYRGGSEPEFVRAQHCSDYHVATCFQPSINSQPDPVAKSVEQQHLLSLSQTQLPRGAGVLYRAEGRRPGSPVVSGNMNDFCVSLCDTGSNCANSRFRYELDRYSSARVHLLQVINELCQIFDRVNVVMRWRGDQCDSGHRVSQGSNFGGDLMARPLSRPPPVLPLRDFDFQLVGRNKISRRYAKPRRSHLFYSAVGVVLTGIVAEPIRVFSTFPTVAASADPVHCDSDRLVCFR